MPEAIGARLKRRGRGFREIVDAAAASHGVSRARVAARIGALRTGGFTPRESLHRGLLDPAEPLGHTLRWHASKRRLVRAQLELNPPPLLPLTEDKELFAREVARRGLPAPRLIAVIGGRGTDGGPRSREWEDALDRCPPEGIVVKPARGFLGRGVRVLRLEGEELVDGRGARRSWAELLEELRDDGQKYVIQERVVDHGRIQELNPSDALQTVRFTMLLDDRPDAVLYSWLKLAPRDAEIDNYSWGRTGTVYADVDPGRGLIRGLWAPRAGGIGSQWVTRHPVTQAELVGASVPLWEEARALAERASRQFLPMRTIGWDIAITRDGPLLVEGNARWDPPPVGNTSGAILRRLRSARTAAP